MGTVHESVWAAVPAGTLPQDFALRRDFLVAHTRPGQIVLDIGCGAGEFSAALTSAGATPIGVDVAREALRRARRQVPGADFRLWGEGAPLPLEDASVDVVWAGEVLEHVADTVLWLSDVRRALRPRGKLVLTTPHHGRARLAMLALSRRRFAEHFEPRSDHLRFFSPGTLSGLLEDLGFDVLDLRLAGGSLVSRSTIMALARRT